MPAIREGRNWSRWLLALAVCLPGGLAMAEDQAPVPEFELAAPPVQIVVLRANTLTPLRLTESVGSDTHQSGAHFTLVVTDDIFVDDRLVIPAGSIAYGQVIHAAKSGVFGKAGELSITSRYLMIGERQVKLHSLFAKAGQTKADLAFGVGMVIPLAPFFIRGKQVLVPADTELIARVAGEESFEFPISRAP